MNENKLWESSTAQFPSDLLHLLAYVRIDDSDLIIERRAEDNNHFGQQRRHDTKLNPKRLRDPNLRVTSELLSEM